MSGKSVRCLTRDDLIFLLNKKSFNVLLNLNRTEFGFFKYLKNGTYKEDRAYNEEQLLELIVKLLSGVCTLKGVNNEAHLNRFFRCLKDCLEFLYNDVPRVLNSCFVKTTNINLASFISGYMVILTAALKKDFFPCIKIVDEIFPELENYLNRLHEKHYKNLEEVLISFNNLKRAVESYTDLEIPDDDDFEVSHFRNLSIVPKDNEIVNYEVLPVPQNIIDRPYNSVEHYLSVHYRLTREDMLRSFRECIKNCKFSSQGNNLYFQNVKVISLPEYKPEGILYDIHVKSSKEVDLSKKGVCLPGSIIFLSNNSFQSVVFALIKNNPSASKGLTKEFTLKIKLEDDCFNTLLQEDFTYELMQPPAYFECYKHVLSAIKKFDESNFPLSDIITYFEFNDTMPSYLDGKILCLHEDCGSSAKHDSSHHCKQFDLVKDDEWPSCTDLKLDEKQYDAFKTAITKKVAVLQGPPGTGKTYVGKKVVKALLENVRTTATKNKDETVNHPIIICCLTNHALDQFLEGIISGGITENVVRLGSQSKSVMLEPHTLDNLIYAVREYKLNSCVGPELQKSLDLLRKFANMVLKQNIGSHVEEHFFEMKDLCVEINSCILSQSLCKNKYLDENALNDIIDANYKETLRKTPGYLKKTLSASILEWLGCSHSNDLYARCEKYFYSFSKMNIKHPVFKNLWDLPEGKRYELFYFWRKLCLESLSRKLDFKLQDYKRLITNYDFTIVNFEKICIVNNASVVGVTTTGASKMKQLIQATRPRIIVFEEAAQILESHVIASLVPSIEHIILIGDHEQLRPLPANHELSESYNLKISMFERLFKNGAPSATLVSQHRMKPCIAELLVPRPYAHYTSADNVYKYEEIRGVQSSVIFFNHCHPEDANSSGTSSSNKFEAQMIACFTKYLVAQQYLDSEITILATYAAQVVLILKCLNEINLSGIHVTTVDNFQGEENEIILLSFVRSNQTSTIGFLKESNRLCVALSRAKQGMFCFGNFDLFARKNDLWESIINKTQTNNMFAENLILQCDKHKFLYPSKIPEDILEFLNSGCPEPCDFLLVCNHRCTLTCHFKDPDHLRYLCKQPCERMMDENRVCPRLCFERCKRAKKKQIELPCGHMGHADIPCFEEVTKHLPCGHFTTISCNRDSQHYKCEAPATRKLECGHIKTISCHEQTEQIPVVCTELRQEIGVCGHIVNVPCSLHFEEAELILFCDKACNTLLNCGHVCVSFCRICNDTGIHGFCTEKCDLMQSCGHECQGYCNSPCPPCKLKCFCECFHGTKCSNKCLRPCVKCQEPCLRRCRHSQCSKKCYEKCDVEPCTEPCLQLLKCGHQCIGLCGDLCPSVCCLCQSELLDDEGPDKSLYVELDCGHIIAVQNLDEHLDNCLLLFEWPSCPQCSQVIKKSIRYKEKLMEAKELCIKNYDTSEVVAEILYLVESMYGEDFIVPAQFLPIHSKVMHIIKKETPKSDSLMVLKNCIMLLKKLVLLAPKLEICEEKYQFKFDTLLLWIFQHLTNASFQQLNELEMAVNELAEHVSQDSDL